MPAQPYSLGIGVQVDYQSIERAASTIEKQLLGAFRNVQRDASKYAGQIAENFAKLGGDRLATALGSAAAPAPTEQLAGMLPEAGIAGLLPGAKGPAQAEQLPMLPGKIGQGGIKNVDKMTDSAGNLTAMLGQLQTMTVEMVAGFSQMNAASQQSGAGLSDVASGMKNAQKRAETLDREIQKKPSDLSKLGQALLGAAKAVGVFADKMRQGFAFTKDAELLEVATIRMAVGLGEGWRKADELRDGIIDLGVATGQSIAGIMKMEAGLVNAGMTFTNFSTQTQPAVISLGRNFGLTGEQIAVTATTLGGFGQDLGDVLGDATTFQKGFKLPGVFEQLPGIVNFARDAFLSFSDRVVGSGADIVKATMNTAGTFAKAFGTTMADATKRAQQAMTKFAQSAQQDQDVFLGLGTEFSGLTMSLMQAGVPIGRAMDLVNSGTQDAVGSAQKYADVLAQMPNKFMKDRFMRQLQKELPQDIFAMVKDTNVLKKALTDKKAAADIEKTWGERGVGAFNDMSTTLQSATSELRELFNNVVQVGKAIGGQIGKMLGLDEMFKGATDTFKNFNKSILAFVKSERFTQWMETIKPYVVGVGKVLLPIGTLIGGIAGSIGSLWGGTKLAQKGLRLVEKPLANLSKMFPRLGKGIGLVTAPFKFLGKIVAKLAGKAFGVGLLVDGFMALKTAVMDMGEVLGDPNATGMEKFEALTRGVLKGVGTFVDGLLLGIPNWLLSKFFPDMEKSFDKGISGIFDTISGWFGDGPGGIFDAVGGWVLSLGDYLASHLPDLAAFTKSFGKALGQVLAFMAKTSVKGLKFLFIDLPIKIVKTEIGLLVSAFKAVFGKTADAGVEAVQEKFTVDRILHTLGSWLSPITDFMVGLGEGIAGSFGTSLEAIGTRFKLVSERIKVVTGSAADFFYDEFMNAWSGLRAGARLAFGAVDKGLIELVSIGKIVAASLSGAWHLAWGAMEVGAMTVLGGVAKALSEFAEKSIDKLRGVMSPLAGLVPGVDALVKKLDAAKVTIAGVGGGFDDLIIKAKTDLNNTLIGSSDKIKAIEAERDAKKKEIDEITELTRKQAKAEIEAREERSAKNTKDHQNRIDQLTRQLALQDKLTGEQQQRSTDARRFEKEARKAEDSAIEAFTKSEKAKRMIGAVGIDAASKYITDRMEKSISSITAEVKAGTLSVEDATKRLDSERKSALIAGGKAGEDAYKKTTNVGAGATAARAGSGPTSGGMSDDAVKQLMENINRGGGRGGNRVTVTLSGGDAVSRALVSKSQVDAKNAGTE
mgnify:FL=1